MTDRVYSTRRMNIVSALATKLKDINGTGSYRTDIGQNSKPKLKFWDEVENFPSIWVTPGPERRVYQGGGYRDRFLMVTVRAYVKGDEPLVKLDELLEDIETVVEANSRLEYTDKDSQTQYTHQMSIVSIDTDEGVLAPLGVGEVQIEVHY